MINKTPLYIAVDMGNVEIVKLLLNRQDIDINTKSISFLYFLNIVSNLLNFLM